jgi:plasmid maintenance system antidote protein VapI
MSSGRAQVLKEAMVLTGTTQTGLARMSGVHQPSISQFLSGRTELSDEMLRRLLECMGYRLQVVRCLVEAELTRSERRSWRLHRQLATHLTRQNLREWRSRIEAQLDRLRAGVSGEPHIRNIERWSELVHEGDLPGLRRVLTGLDRDSVQMREVSPMGGLLSQDERTLVLAGGG